jgi:hypothetical protein
MERAPLADHGALTTLVAAQKIFPQDRRLVLGAIAPKAAVSLGLLISRFSCELAAG